MRQRQIGDIADDIQRLAATIKEKQDEIDVLESQELALKAELIKAAEAAGLTAGKTTTASWKVEQQTVPQVKDWESFYEYIMNNQYFHLLQKRPAVKACQELWDKGIVIPGAEKFTQPKVSVKGV